MSKIFVLFIFCAAQFYENSANAPGEVWVTRARVVDDIAYFMKVMQEFTYEVERREWSSLQMVNVTQNISTIVANWNVNGTVLYTNGFVKSVQKIDLSAISSVFTRVIQENVVIPSVTVRGTLHFRHMNIGYDVYANLTGLGEHRYTGEILNNNIQWGFSVSKNLITEEMTVSVGLSGIEGSFIRMIYRPQNNITEVLSRSFGSFNNWSGVASWAQSFREIFTDIVLNKVDFPRICFNDCT